MNREYRIGKFILKEISNKVIIRTIDDLPTPVNELYNSEMTKQLFIALIERIEQLESEIRNPRLNNEQK